MADFSSDTTRTTFSSKCDRSDISPKLTNRVSGPRAHEALRGDSVATSTIIQGCQLRLSTARNDTVEGLPDDGLAVLPQIRECRCVIGYWVMIREAVLYRCKPEMALRGVR